MTQRRSQLSPCYGAKEINALLLLLSSAAEDNVVIWFRDVVK